MASGYRILADRLLWVGTNPGGGGTETHMITFLRALATTGIETHALVHPHGKIAKALAQTEVRLWHGTFRNSADPNGFLALHRAMRKLQPQLLVGSFSKEYWPLALASRTYGVPLVLFRHMDLGLRPSTRWLLSRWPLRLVAISQYLQGRLVAHGIPAPRVEYVPNPLFVEELVPAPAARCALRTQLGLAADTVLVGFVGAWHRGKGVFLLADALDQAHAQDPRIHGLWIGGGAHETQLRERLAARPWHHLVGWSDQVYPWYGAMDLLALPSIEPDTFGRVLVEAQAAALPVLGAEIGGIPEAFAPEQTGRLLPAGVLAPWREGIVSVAGDPDLRARWGAAGPQFVQRFAAPRVAQDFLTQFWP